MNNLEKLVVDKLEALKCTDIKIVDVKDVTPLYSTFISATSRTTSSLNGAKEAVMQLLKEEGIKVKHVEFKNRSLWCLIDAYDLLIHLFAPGERERMRFDDIYQNCPTTMISEEAEKIVEQPTGEDEKSWRN